MGPDSRCLPGRILRDLLQAARLQRVSRSRATSRHAAGARSAARPWVGAALVRCQPDSAVLRPRTSSEVSERQTPEGARYGPRTEASHLRFRAARRLPSDVVQQVLMGSVPARMVRAREAKEETDTVGHCPTTTQGARNMKRFAIRLMSDEY